MTLVLYLIIERIEKIEYPQIFITSNQNLTWIAENMSDRIASRISGICEVAKIIDKDWRIKNS